MADVDPITIYCESQQYPLPDREYRFAPPRMFRLDWGWPGLKLGIEKDGIYPRGPRCPTCGKQTRAGAHGSVAQLKSDRVKSNLALELGWKVYRVLPEEIEDGSVYGLLDRILGATP